jgi:hypothetical protein
MDREIDEAAEEEIQRFRKMVDRRKAMLSAGLDTVFPGELARGLAEIAEGRYGDGDLVSRLLGRRVVDHERVPDMIQKLRNMSTITSLVNIQEPLRRPSCTCPDDLANFE